MLFDINYGIYSESSVCFLANNYSLEKHPYDESKNEE
jgi:hypothetical protein